MPSPDIERYSYLRMSREIVPSESLLEFLEAARKTAFDGRFQGFREHTTPSIFLAESLRVTLFERRVKAGAYLSELLKLDHYLTNPEHIHTERIRVRPGGPLKTVKKTRVNPLPAALKEPEDGHADKSGILYVHADEIVESTPEDYGHHGVQLALRIGDSEGAQVLEAQSELIIDAAMRTYAGRAIPRPAEPDDPRLIPFMWAQFEDDAALEEYLDLLHPELPVYEIGCLAVEGDRKLRPA